MQMTGSQQSVAGVKPGAPPSVMGLRPRSISLILLAAFLVNVVILFVVLPGITKVVASRYSVGFQDLYDMIAENLVLGNGYRVEPGMGETMLREPGYPLFLAGVFKAGGYHIEAARLANLLLVFVIAFAMMRLTLRITGDRLTALLAALLFVLYPGTLMAVARAGVEITYICTLMLFMLALHYAVEAGRLWRYGVAGLLLGVAVMVRSEVLSFPFFVLVYLILIEKGIRARVQALFKVAILVLGMAVVMLPWVIRNYRLSGEFVPTATVAGVAAQEGLYTCRNLAPDRPFWAVQLAAGNERGALAESLGLPFVGRYYYQFFYHPQDEVVFNKALLKGATAEYRSNPLLLGACAGKNLFFNFWFLGKTWQATGMNAMLQLPLLVLGLGGGIILWKRGLLRKMGIVLAFILYVPLLHAPIIAHARHSIVVLPFLAILTSVALVSLWNARKSNKLRETLIAG